MVGSFTARRSKPELVAPARSTPSETKPLSDLDDDRDLRYLQPALEFFRPVDVDSHRRRAVDDDDDSHNPAAKAIKAALAEALVYYYPIAGRLRELRNGKLAVDCTGEGVVFVEAEADVRLEDLGRPPLPPYPYAGEFLCDVGDGRDVVSVPLFFMQVTRLKCGGFVVGSQICHNIADGYGTIQFLKDIFDLARGKAKPTTLPVWERELLMARNPPQISHKYEALFNEVGRVNSDDIMLITPAENMVWEYFTFSPSDVAALQCLVPLHLIETVTSFELLTAIMWRSRTLALGYHPGQLVRLKITMTARKRWSILSDGFYGNALLCPIVETTVNDLCTRPLGDTIELIRKAKLEMRTEENMRSMVDLMAILRERAPVKIDRLYSSCDIKWLGEDELDIGWAKRMSGGIPAAGNKSPEIMSDHFVYKNKKGEKMIVVSMLLPMPAMDRFRKEMAVWLKNH